MGWNLALCQEFVGAAEVASCERGGGGLCEGLAAAGLCESVAAAADGAEEEGDAAARGAAHEQAACLDSAHVLHPHAPMTAALSAAAAAHAKDGDDAPCARGH